MGFLINLEKENIFLGQILYQYLSSIGAVCICDILVFIILKQEECR